MPKIKTSKKRIVLLKLVNCEDVMCNLLICKSDLPHGLFRKTTLRDQITGRECVCVTDPVRYINQINIRTGDQANFLASWAYSTIGKIYLIPIDQITTCQFPSKDSQTFYEEFIQKQKNPEIIPPIEEEAQHTKFISPGPKVMQ